MASQGEDQLTQDLSGHLVTESAKWRGLEQARRGLDCAASGHGCLQDGLESALLEALYAEGRANGQADIVSDGEYGSIF